jgi:hypothetical protein
MAPNAPIGASRMMMPKAANSMCEKPSIPSSTGFAAAPMRVSPKPQSTASSSTGSTSPSANAPKPS